MSAAASAGPRYRDGTAGPAGPRYGGTYSAGTETGASSVPPGPTAAGDSRYSPAHCSASRPAGGRLAGSTASAAVTSGSSGAGTPASSAFPCSTRKKTVWYDPTPYGGL